MTAQSGCHSDQLTCVYCGLVRHSYKLVSQTYISSDKSLQSFAKSKLITTNSDHRNYNYYICFDHEIRLRIKYLHFKYGREFTIRFDQKGSKQNITFSCAICQTWDHVKCHHMHSIQTLSLKNYVIYKMQREGKISTKEGSGITENENLCYKCYKSVQKKCID